MEGATGDKRSTGIIVIAVQDCGAGAGLREGTASGHRPADRDLAGTVDDEGGVVRDVSAADRAIGTTITDLEDSAGDGCSSSVVVARSGEDLGARTLLRKVSGVVRVGKAARECP